MTRQSRAGLDDYRGQKAADVFHAALQGAPDGIVIVGDDGTVLHVNAAACALLGWEAAAVVGRPVQTLLLDPEDGPAGFLGAAGEPGGSPQSRHLAACRRADGSMLTIEAAVSRIDTASGDGHGATLFVAIVRDLGLGLGEASEEAEARIGSIAANIPGIVFQRVREPDGTLYYPFFSSGVRDVLGLEPEQMRVNRDGCLDVIHWADRDDHLKAVRQSAARLSPCREEFRAITRHGEVKWLRGTSRPSRMPGGEVLWDGVIIDVTDRKVAERQLELIMDHAYDSIITIDEEGKMLSANAATESLFGYQMDELIGRDVSMLMPEPYRGKHNDYIRRYLETGEGRIVGAGPCEFKGEHKDGHDFALELALSEVRMEGRLLFIGVMRDITERKRTEAALRETEQRLSGIAANIPGMVFQRVMKPGGAIEFTYVSGGCRDLLGTTPEELLADPSLFLNGLANRDRIDFLDALRTSARTLEPLEDEFPLVTPAGRRWLRGWSRPRRLDNGDVVWDGVTLDVTDRKQAEESLLFLAYYDPVTQVGNRALFLDRYARAIASPDFDGALIAVLSLGIDRFSIINASMGHTVGDQVLAAAADRLRNRVTDGDTIARAGGDRFLVLLSETTGEEGLGNAVDAIMGGFADPITIDGQEFDVTVSVGVSVHPRDGRDAETLIKNADTALHRAKAKGPASVQFFTAELSAQAARTLMVQNRLRHALEKGEFVAYYQPQIDIRTGTLVGMEALVRWIDPERGLIPPGEFISIAEDYGLIDIICDQVLRYTARSLRAWQEEGLGVVPVAVNVSGRQFQNSRRLLATLEQVLKETGIDPSLIEIELTESSAMSDPENAIAVVNILRDMGIACAIDDFGTGYSSLGVLKQFPIAKLKIDRSFVKDVIHDSNDAAIVSAIIAMAHALKLDVIAEGVEEIPHLEFLRNLGCDQIQGYLISRPLPHDDIRRFMRNWRWDPQTVA